VLHALAERVLRRQVRTSFCIASRTGNAEVDFICTAALWVRDPDEEGDQESTSGCRTGSNPKRNAMP